MEFLVDQLNTVENEMKSEIKGIAKAVNVSSAAKVNKNLMMRLNKKPLAKYVESLVNLAEKNITPCKSAVGKWTN